MLMVNTCWNVMGKTCSVFEPFSWWREVSPHCWIHVLCIKCMWGKASYCKWKFSAFLVVMVTSWLIYSNCVVWCGWTCTFYHFGYAPLISSVLYLMLMCPRFPSVWTILNSFSIFLMRSCSEPDEVTAIIQAAAPSRSLNVSRLGSHACRCRGF